MTEHTNSPKFTDDQMDQLLNAFYGMEVPEKLDRLPSSWPEIANSRSEEAAPAQVTVAKVEPSSRQSSGTGRGLVVAVATLSACLMIFVASQFNPSGVQPGGTAGSVEPPDRDAPGALINVSENPGQNGAVDENGLTVGELENIDLESPDSSSPQDSEEPRE